jgi:hypothetical protein
MHTEICGFCWDKKAVNNSDHKVAIIMLKLKFITYAEIKPFVS